MEENAIQFIDRLGICQHIACISIASIVIAVILISVGISIASSIDANVGGATRTIIGAARIDITWSVVRIIIRIVANISKISAVTSAIGVDMTVIINFETKRGSVGAAFGFVTWISAAAAATAVPAPIVV